jgi:hypothetical protein
VTDGLTPVLRESSRGTHLMAAALRPSIRIIRKSKVIHAPVGVNRRQTFILRAQAQFTRAAAPPGVSRPVPSLRIERLFMNFLHIGIAVFMATLMR